MKAKPPDFEITSISSFATKVEALLGAALTRQKDAQYKGIWYRGVGKSDHTLTPTLFRHKKTKDIDSLIRMERYMLEDFVRQNILHTHGSIAPYGSDDLRTLFYMQHYGVPTRLLDWSNNPFIALYFALSTAKKKTNSSQYASDAAVWVLDPVAWNKIALDQVTYGDQGPLHHDATILSASYGPRKVFNGKLEPTAISSLYSRPVAILGITNNSRMYAQSGVFTMFGRDTDPLERQYRSAAFPTGCLTRIIIRRKNIAPLLEKLMRIGYADSVIYPDLHGLAMEIRRFRGFEVA